MASIGRIVAPSVIGLGMPSDWAGIKEIGVDDAVHHPGGFIGTDAVGALGPGSAAGLNHHAGAQAQKVLVVAAIQRHVDDVRVVEGAAEGGVGGLHQRHGFGDRDGLFLLAGLKSQVDANFLADSDVNVLALEFLETLGLGANCKVAGSQVGSVIFSGVVRGQRSRDASVPCPVR